MKKLFIASGAIVLTLGIAAGSVYATNTIKKEASEFTEAVKVANTVEKVQPSKEVIEEKPIEAPLEPSKAAPAPLKRELEVEPVEEVKPLTDEQVYATSMKIIYGSEKLKGRVISPLSLYTVIKYNFPKDGTESQLTDLTNKCIDFYKDKLIDNPDTNKLIVQKLCS